MRMEQKLTNSIRLASGPPRCCSTTLIKGMPPNFRTSDTSCTRFPFDGLIYRVSSDSMAGVTGDRTHKFSLRVCLGAIRRTRFITQKFRKEFMLD